MRETTDSAKVAAAFTCPRCGGHRLEEVVCQVTASYEVVEYYPEGDLEYGDADMDGGKVDRYQCRDCGWVVPQVADGQGLIAWLLQQQENKNT
jgi:predicted RNA-binding Zn-ribbon protein involved in translation (DUF1610 family)